MDFELYDDVMKDEPKISCPEDMETKEYKEWKRRLDSSLGRINQIIERNKYGQDDELLYKVVSGKGGDVFYKKYRHAEFLSYLLQVNERLKRVESKLENLVK